MSKVVFENIKFDRSIFKGDCSFENIDKNHIVKIFIKEKKTNEIITISTYDIIDNKIKIRIPVLAVKNESPLTNGRWYFYVGLKDGSEVLITISDFVYKKVHLLNYDGEAIDAVYDKSQSNYFHGYSRVDLKKEALYLFVDYIVPIPENNILKIWVRNVKSRHKSRLTRIRKIGFVYLFKLFNSKKKSGNKIFFTSSSRSEIGGNHKFVYDRMIERGMGNKYEFRFDYKENIDSYRSIKNKILFTYYLATSDYIFVDDYQPEIYKNDYNKDVKIIQLWHACGAFKTLGFERLNAKGAPGFNTRVHKCYTHVPVSSQHSARHHAEAFGIDECKCYPVGIARTDVFFDEEYKANVRKSIYKIYPSIKKASKVIMYAPTFRGNNAKDAYFPQHMLDYYKLGKYLKSVNGIMVIKMHPFVKETIEIPDEYKDYFIDASPYREVNDLLMVSDVLITDYSSVIYEMALLGKPMIFYAFDIETYETTRGFYEPFKDIIPGDNVKNMDQLVEVLEKEDYNIDKLNDFIKKNFKYTDGKSTDRVIDLVFNDIIPE
ncbi:MAG: CDP-glycerol glycerophosphotransferase family protein [Anaerovoracaceae bacterium]